MSGCDLYTHRRLAALMRENTRLRTKLEAAAMQAGQVTNAAPSQEGRAVGLASAAAPTPEPAGGMPEELEKLLAVVLPESLRNVLRAPAEQLQGRVKELEQIIEADRGLITIWKERAEQAETRLREAEKALKEIAEGKGEFSLDRLQHATNTIEGMKAIANTALAAQGESDERAELCGECMGSGKIIVVDMSRDTGGKEIGRHEEQCSQCRPAARVGKVKGRNGQ